MRLENSFEVPAPPERAWDLLLDVERVIPCMPGAELTEVVDETHWKATMNVKLGPIALAFATDVAREETDEAARRVRLSANGRDTRGRGGAKATIESTLAQAGNGTRVDIVTDLSLSGPVAQYGRGIVQDVAGQLTKQFAECVARQLGDDQPAAGGDAATEVGEQPPLPSEAAPAAHEVKPVGGLRLLFGALFRRLFRRRTG